MTGMKIFPVNLKPYSNYYVIFSDGGKGKIFGKCQLNYPRLFYVIDVLLVDGPTTNLIIVSQLCDQQPMIKMLREPSGSHMITGKWASPGTIPYKTRVSPGNRGKSNRKRTGSRFEETGSCVNKLKN